MGKALEEIVTEILVWSFFVIKKSYSQEYGFFVLVFILLFKEPGSIILS